MPFKAMKEEQRRGQAAENTACELRLELELWKSSDFRLSGWATREKNARGHEHRLEHINHASTELGDASCRQEDLPANTDEGRIKHHHVDFSVSCHVLVRRHNPGPSWGQ